MTTEQKEAIETMQHWIEYAKQNKDKINKVDELIGIQETVLNLIQEKDKEIEKYKKLYQKALNDAVVTAHDNMHKDKIIDELAKAFKQDDVRSVEEIKQFYERKVENDNSKE